MIVHRAVVLSVAVLTHAMPRGGGARDEAKAAGGSHVKPGAPRYGFSFALSLTSQA
jgi:hypothetical protein